MNYLEKYIKATKDLQFVFKNFRQRIIFKSSLEKALSEATSNDQCLVSSKVMQEIQNKTFQDDGLQKIVDKICYVLDGYSHKWCRIYKGLNLIEFLLKNGSTKFYRECEFILKPIIQNYSNFKLIDEGQDRGLQIRNKVEYLLDLLKNQELLKQERINAKKQQGQIVGIGSTNYEGSAYNFQERSIDNPQRIQSNNINNQELSIDQTADQLNKQSNGIIQMKLKDQSKFAQEIFQNNFKSNFKHKNYPDVNNDNGKAEIIKKNPDCISDKNLAKIRFEIPNQISKLDLLSMEFSQPIKTLKEQDQNVNNLLDQPIQQESFEKMQQQQFIKDGFFNIDFNIELKEQINQQQLQQIPQQSILVDRQVQYQNENQQKLNQYKNYSEFETKLIDLSDLKKEIVSNQNNIQQQQRKKK